MAAPDMDAARRAADALVSAGAGRVLLFGSVARGKATERSDIDLVAIYDDLGDYSDRGQRRCALEAQAAAAAGCVVDIVVTDAPEWAVRTTRVPCSLEARVVSHAVELANVGAYADINWDKEIGLPADPTAELQSRFMDMSNAVVRLETSLRPTIAEIASADEDDSDEHRYREDVRFATAMADVLAIIESAAKVTHVASRGTAPMRSHNIRSLLEPQPASVTDAFWALASSEVDLENLHLWRQGFTYVEDRPDLPSEDGLRAHCAAALGIAAVAADLCRLHGISESELSRWDQRARRCNAALNGQIRHFGSADRSIGRQDS